MGFIGIWAGIEQREGNPSFAWETRKHYVEKYFEKVVVEIYQPEIWISISAEILQT